MAITCKHIADMVGVSRQAAASVLNNAPKCLVSKEKKEQILALAEKYHYVRNNAARTLRRGKSGIIGILSGGMHIVRTGITLLTLDKVLRSQGFLPVIIYTANEYDAITSGIRSLIQQNVDGLIINGIPPCRGENCTIAELKKSGLLNLCPTILTNCEHDCAVPTVSYSYEEVINGIVDRISMHRFSHIRPVLRARTFEAGFAIRETVKRLNIPALPAAVIGISEILSPDRFRNDILKDVRSAANSHLPGTLYLCDTGSSANQICLSLMMRYGKIPEDAGIIVFDHTERFNYLTPAVTAVNLNFDLFAQKSWELLHECMSDRSICRKVDIPAELVIRETF